MGDFFHILVILFVGFSVVLSETRTTNMREDVGQKDKIPFDGSLTTIETQSKINCAILCSMAEKCMSMFYKSKTKQCVLHKFLGGYLNLHQSITTSSSGWKYYENGLGVYIRNERCLTNGFVYDPAADVCYITDIMVFDFDIIKERCAELNSELIKITSQEKEDWITSKLTTNTGHMICIQGNNDNKMEYQFDDGTPMTYFNWNSAAGQPDGGDEHYIYMKKNTKYNMTYKWNDMPKIKPTYQCVVVCEQ